jgi:hypothetical protein
MLSMIQMHLQFFQTRKIQGLKVAIMISKYFFGQIRPFFLLFILLLTNKLKGARTSNADRSLFFNFYYSFEYY